MRHLPLGAPVDITSRGRTGNWRRALKSPDQVVKITAELMGKVALIGQRCWTGLCRDGSEVSLQNICCLLTQPATDVFIQQVGAVCNGQKRWLPGVTG